MKNSGCFKFVICIILFNIFLGGWSVNLILSWFGKDIPFFFDSIIGLFVAALSFPVAIVGSILQAFGIF